MKRQLVPYIPFSCSLVRRPLEDGDVPDLRVHAGFTPAWFRQHMDLDYGIEWHTDHLLRVRSFKEMGRVLNRIFPELRLGGEPDKMIGSISQVQTCCLMAAFFGQDIRYFPNNWPANHGATLDDNAADNLEPPDFRSHPIYADLMRQMALIEREWGRVEGEINYQGVLNTAFRLRGEQIFIDMLDAPARVHHILDVVCQTMKEFADDVHARQSRPDASHDYFVTGNCVVNMISASQYREFVMPRDLELATHFPVFGVHNCAWNVDPYAPAYAELPRLAYLDFGMTSDFPLLRRLFPETTLAAMYSPVELVNNSLDDIRCGLERLHAEIGKCRIILADIDAGTPPERVVDFFRLASEIWGIPVADLVPEPSRW